MALLIIGILLFLGIHLIRVIAPGIRRTAIERIGKPAWIGAYSAASVASLGILAYGYDAARQVTGVLYTPPAWGAHLTLSLMLLASICLAAGLLPAGHIATKSKHPMVLSVKIWAVSHLLANGETAAVVLFVAFLAWGVILRIALKRRERSGDLVRRPLVSGRYDLAAIAVGLVFWALMIWKLHEWLIGVAPIALG